MCKRDEDIDLRSGNVQIQPWKFEPSKSGRDLVKINLIGSDLTSWHTISTRLPTCITNERIDQMDWWAFLNMNKTTLQRLLIKLMNIGYLRVFVLFYFENWDVYNSLLSVRKTGKISCFVGSFSISPSCWRCFTWHVGVVFVLRISRVTEFSKVTKWSVQRKIVKVLSKWKLKYNITWRNLFRSLWFQRWFSL